MTIVSETSGGSSVTKLREELEAAKLSELSTFAEADRLELGKDRVDAWAFRFGPEDVQRLSRMALAYRSEAGPIPAGYAVDAWLDFRECLQGDCSPRLISMRSGDCREEIDRRLYDATYDEIELIKSDCFLRMLTCYAMMEA